ncbi:hypothetical protein BZG01_01575 [Labilibaculum manganireducens]|uniref:Lipocalin-like domain-containing protein n=1 Tax=Labilibaculum manganireducens TaxID=1940525 RepID=A0A2N3IFB8_9BACT|nr:hypothetical protein [Labilibaculum manganireducens]PKQ69022.1 hypothetical protein BZG01_01575 [Labilibaculum manganireducens]
MKKATIILIVLLSLIKVTNAQDSKISGSWLVTKIVVGDQVDEPLFVIDYRADGSIITQGIDVGSWSHNQKEEKLIMSSDMDKDFGGDCKIMNLNQKELNFEKGDQKWFLSRLNMDEIAKNNSESGLIGSWKFADEENTDVTRVLIFEAPDSFSFIEKEPGMEGRTGGMWIFNPKEQSLLLIGRIDQIGGKNKILTISKTELVLENAGVETVLLKSEANSQNIERLTFTEADFFDANGDYKYDGEENKLPWTDPFEMLMSLVNTSQLEYNFSTLVEGTNVFETKKLTADVKTDKEEQSVSIDFIFYGYDRYNLPDETELPPNVLDFNYYNRLYPLQENSFRVAGQEKLTTPSGTFDCTVIESVGTSEEKYKLWMINDKPGVYAKIIEDKEGMFGHYYMYELNKIIEAK